MLSKIALAAFLAHAASGCAASAIASLACDYGQTRTMAMEGYSNYRYEGNPLLGRKPSEGKIDACFALTTAAIVLTGELLPENAQKAFYGVITVGEAWTSYKNIKVTPGVCGVR